MDNFIYQPPHNRALSIHHVDRDLLIVDKPAGLLSVPGKHDAHKDCLESRVKTVFPDARIVHRLDMDTSGLIVFARNAQSHRHLGLQFERRHVFKKYIACVFGQVEQDEGLITLPLRCDWPNRPKQMVCHEAGRTAETLWQVISRDKQSTKVALFPKTGRSHQLRVHMLELGHPILGDRFYANGDALNCVSRLQLHAAELQIFHPDGGRKIHFKSFCPF